jgi:outer membrane protein assembly factor BamA
MKDSGFTDYNIRMFLEDAVRRAYEEHGMYRVQFPKVTATPAGKLLVNVKGEVVEGAQFKLGKVNFIGGPAVPVADMLKAAKFKTGEVANWRDIQQSVVALQRPMMRVGYRDAKYEINRVLDDATKELNLEVPVELGPLYHFGQVTFQGLAPDADAKAHQMWKKKPGDIYDAFYFNDFAGEFLQAVRAEKVAVAQNEQVDGEHVVNLTVTFKKQAK